MEDGDWGLGDASIKGIKISIVSAEPFSHTLNLKAQKNKTKALLAKRLRGTILICNITAMNQAFVEFSMVQNFKISDSYLKFDLVGNK